MGGHRQVPHRHVLYEAAVQSPATDLDFVERVYRRTRGRTFRRLREDFCGTAALTCEWARRRAGNLAWGVDLHGPTLDWGREHRVARLGKAAERVQLLQADVLTVARPKVDVVMALNFSYSVFKERDSLGRYFERVRRCLLPGGMFFADAFGGQETMGELVERNRIAATRDWDGRRVPAFTYVWEQARFNAVDHHIVCHIHFHLPRGTRLRRAFSYDWRLWTLPELRELMRDAGFRATEVYIDGWDERAEEGDGIFRRRTRYPNQAGWVAYVVGIS